MTLGSAIQRTTATLQADFSQNEPGLYKPGLQRPGLYRAGLYRPGL